MMCLPFFETHCDMLYSVKLNVTGDVADDRSRVKARAGDPATRTTTTKLFVTEYKLVNRYRPWLLAVDVAPWLGTATTAPRTT